MSSGYIVIDPRERPRVPWANGHGVTRECARDPAGAWRLSVADLDSDAPFSVLPGLDRLFILLAGELTLTVNGRRRSLVAGEVTRFRGEDAVTVSTRRPAQAANLMVTRDRAAVTYRRADVDRRLGAPRGGGELLVLLTPARARDGEMLPAGSALVPGPQSADDGPRLPLAGPVRLVRFRVHRTGASAVAVPQGAAAGSTPDP